MAPSPKRPRCGHDQSSNEKLLTILAKYFDVPTVIKYGQSLRKSKLHSQELVRHKKLLVELRSVQANLSFTQKQLQDLLQSVATQILPKSRLEFCALCSAHGPGSLRNESCCALRALLPANSKVASSKKAEWKFQDSDITDFSSEVAGRIRTMCRHLGHALRRDPMPMWAQSAFGMFAGESSDEKSTKLQVQKKSLTPPDSSPDFFVGWNAELGNAWRVDGKDGSTKHAEYAISIKYPENALDMDNIIAVWKDGFEKHIMEVTVMQHRMLVAGSKKARDNQNIEECDDGLKLVKKKDRLGSLITLMGKDKKQLCQAGVRHYESEGDAWTLMRKVAQRAAAGECPKEVRGELWNEYKAKHENTEKKAKHENTEKKKKADENTEKKAPFNIDPEFEDITDRLLPTPTEKTKLEVPPAKKLAPKKRPGVNATSMDEGKLSMGMSLDEDDLMDMMSEAELVSMRGVLFEMSA